MDRPGQTHQVPKALVKPAGFALGWEGSPKAEQDFGSNCSGAALWGALDLPGVLHLLHGRNGGPITPVCLENKPSFSCWYCRLSPAQAPPVPRAAQGVALGCLHLLQSSDSKSGAEHKAVKKSIHCSGLSQPPAGGEQWGGGVSAPQPPSPPRGAQPSSGSGEGASLGALLSCIPPSPPGGTRLPVRGKR